MANLISLSDITTITGLTDSELTSLIPYAQAQAEAVLGFLEKEDKTFERYIREEQVHELFLEDRPINSVSSITYTLTSSSTAAAITKYRTIVDEGHIIFDEWLIKGSIISITYSRGWDADDVTDLVKLYLSVLAVCHFYSLYPDKQVASQVIVQKRIGDVATKYASIDPKSFKTLEQWCDHLAALIKYGGTSPDVTSL